MFYHPHQRQDTKWVYSCCEAGGEPCAIGYCAGGTDPGYHDDGHATSDEACACYRTFQLETALEFIEESGLREPCATCGTWTMGRGRIKAESSIPSVPLCPEHQTLADMTAAL